MRGIGIALTTVLLLISQGCFIHVDVDDKGHRWSEDDEWDTFSDWQDWPGNDDDEDDDDEDDDDEADEAPQIDVDLGTDVLENQGATLLEIDIDGDATVEDLEEVVFPEGIEVLDMFERDGDLYIAVWVDIEPGTIEVIFDFGDLGEVTVEVDVLGADGQPATDGGDERGADGSAGGSDGGSDGGAGGPEDCDE
jgi:hypothetical protein